MKKEKMTPNNHFGGKPSWTNEGGVPKEEVLAIINANIIVDIYLGGTTPIYCLQSVKPLKAKMLKDGESEYVDVVYDEENDIYVASDETEIEYSLEEDGIHFSVSANITDFKVEEYEYYEQE